MPALLYQPGQKVIVLESPPRKHAVRTGIVDAAILVNEVVEQGGSRPLNDGPQYIYIVYLDNLDLYGNNRLICFDNDLVLQE